MLLAGDRIEYFGADSAWSIPSILCALAGSSAGGHLDGLA
jgi:hypothetical protein